MLKRKFGKQQQEVSILGFGAMRLPIIGDDYNNIDEPEAIKQIRHAIDNGLTYVDTAYPYHGGNSELVVGKALRDGYREKVKLATKLPSWEIKTAADFDRILNEQLEKLQTDYVDFYMLHALNKGYWEMYKRLNVFEFFDRALADGRIKEIGFSFHDELDVFKEIIDDYDWGFCQIQYNIMDQNYQAGEEGLKYAGEKGISVVVMEPLRGGTLVNNVPDDVKKLWGSERTAAQWALRFIWNHPEVTVIISGMNAISQIDENIAEAGRALPNSLTKDELATIDKVQKIYNSRMKVNCTSCKYCMPCPYGVNIPGCFYFLNNASILKDVEFYKERYGVFIHAENRADMCQECGQCEAVCPQHIEIIDMLKVVSETFK